MILESTLGIELVNQKTEVWYREKKKEKRRGEGMGGDGRGGEKKHKSTEALRPHNTNAVILPCSVWWETHFTSLHLN